MNSFFLEIALPRLHRLASAGVSITTEPTGRCEVVAIRKGAKRIQICYEPYGPPFCELNSNGEDSRRIEVVVPFPSAERMGRGDKTEGAIAELKSDLCRYVDGLVPILEDELK